MYRLNRGITGSWWFVALNLYLALSIVGTTLLMIDPGDTYVSAFIGPLMSVLLPAHVMYIAIVFALPQMIYLVLAAYGLLNLISTRRPPPSDFMSCRHGGGAGLGDRTRLQATSAASTKGPQLGSFSLSQGQSPGG